MYPDAACRALDAALAGALGVTPDNIVCANGSDDILNFCFMAYGERGALFPEITYGFYEVFCALHGIDERRAPMHLSLIHIFGRDLKRDALGGVKLRVVLHEGGVAVCAHVGDYSGHNAGHVRAGGFAAHQLGVRGLSAFVYLQHVISLLPVSR